MSGQDVYAAFIAEVEALAIKADMPAVAVVGELTRAVKRAQMAVDRTRDGLGHTVTEWNALGVNGLTWGDHGTTEASARATVEKSSPSLELRLVSHQRTTFPDVVTEWADEVIRPRQPGVDA